MYLTVDVGEVSISNDYLMHLAAASLQDTDSRRGMVNHPLDLIQEPLELLDRGFRGESTLITTYLAVKRIKGLFTPFKAHGNNDQPPPVPLREIKEPYRVGWCTGESIKNNYITT
jgi:hypothetical protein